MRHMRKVDTIGSKLVARRATVLPIIENAARHVENVTSVTIDQMRSDDSSGRVLFARSLAMSLAYAMAKSGAVHMIGEYFERDRGAVLDAVQIVMLMLLSPDSEQSSFRGVAERACALAQIEASALIPAC